MSKINVYFVSVMKFYSPNRRKMAKKPQTQQPKVVNHSLNYQFDQSKMEIASSISQTVPNQDPDLKKLISQGLNGMPITQKIGQYTDTEIPDLELMDDVEILMYREELAERMDALKDEHHAFTKELEKRTLDEAFEKRFQEELAKRQAAQAAPTPSGQDGQP